MKPYGVDNYPTRNVPRTLRNFAPSAAAVRDGYIFVLFVTEEEDMADFHAA